MFTDLQETRGKMTLLNRMMYTADLNLYLRGDTMPLPFKHRW